MRGMGTQAGRLQAPGCRQLRKTMSQNQGLPRLWLGGTEVPNMHEALGSVTNVI